MKLKVKLFENWNCIRSRNICSAKTECELKLKLLCQNST